MAGMRIFTGDDASVPPNTRRSTPASAPRLAPSPMPARARNQNRNAPRRDGEHQQADRARRKQPQQPLRGPQAAQQHHTRADERIAPGSDVGCAVEVAGHRQPAAGSRGQQHPQAQDGPRHSAAAQPAPAGGADPGESPRRAGGSAPTARRRGARPHPGPASQAGGCGAPPAAHLHPSAGASGIPRRSGRSESTSSQAFNLAEERSQPLPERGQPEAGLGRLVRVALEQAGWGRSRR
jgi:hypothetical protein